MCLTRCSMSDIDGDKLVMPGCLVRGPPTYSRNLCVPRVGLPKLGDSVQTFRESMSENFPRRNPSGCRLLVFGTTKSEGGLSAQSID
jgi:hypothetical protein